VPRYRRDSPEVTSVDHKSLWVRAEDHDRLVAELRAALDKSLQSGVLQAVLDAIAGTLDPATQIADHPNVKFAQMERLKLVETLKELRAQQREDFARAEALQVRVRDLHAIEQQHALQLAAAEARDARRDAAAAVRGGDA